MKVLYVVEGLGAYGGVQQFRGGIQQYATTQANYAPPDIDVRIVPWSNPMKRWQRAMVHYAPAAIAAPAFKRLYRGGELEAITPSDFDVRHHWHVYSAMASDAIDRRTVVTVHGSEILHTNVERYKRPILEQTLGHAGAVTAISTFTRDYLLNNYDVDPAHVQLQLPGIDLDEYKPGVRKDPGTIRIGTLSRLIPRKNVLRIVEAMTILQDRFGVDFEFVLAGDGAQREQVLAALRATKLRWRYLGLIDEADKVDNFYPSLDVFVMPPLALTNDVEGFGVVLVEANASGVPVVTSRTGGITDAVDETASGRFADPADATDIASKTFDILNAAQNWSETTRAWAETLSAPIAADRFFSLYRTLSP